MKSILCGIVAIAVLSLVAWAIAPWILLLWFTRNYQVIKPKSSDFPFETVNVDVEVSSSNTEVDFKLEDYWQDDEPVIQVETPAPVGEIQEIPIVEIKEEEPIEVKPTLVFPPCPENLQKLTTRQLQLLCGEINKIKRGSISGYRTKKDKDKQQVVALIEAFYQTI